MKSWHLPLLVFEGALALLVTYCAGDGWTQCGTVSTTREAMLIMRDADGRTTHAHMVRPSTEITLNEAPAQLGDLHVGDQVAITLGKEDGMPVVRKVAARSTTATAETVADMARFD